VQSTQTPVTAPAPQTKTAPAKPQPPPAAAASPTTGWTERVVSAPVVGEASVYIPRHPTTQNVVLFISGDGDWKLGVIDMARMIMPKAVVIGVSYNALRKAPPPDVTCWSPEADLVAISHAVQKEINLPEYRLPILVGYSSGATMVYHALVTAPQEFSGGLSLGFCPDMPSNHNVCGLDNFKIGPHDAKRNEVDLPKVDKLAREWFILNGIQDQVCLPDAMHKYLDDMGGAHPIIDIEGTGHGFSKPQHWGPPFNESIDKLMVIATAVGKTKAPVH
jgi:predicted esterase